MKYHQHVIKLWLFFFFLLFLSGRIGLFLHEFAGHALTWHLIGGNLSGFSLFIFGGGRVQFAHMESPFNLSVTQQLVVQLSGIAVELFIGIILAFVAFLLIKRQDMKALLASAAGVLVVHSLHYLTIGTYYGLGDGRLLSKILPEDYRLIFLFLTFGLTIAAAFLISYFFSAMLKNWVIDCSPKQRNVVIIICAFLATALHGIFTVGERIVVNDKVYAEIKTSENDRLKEVALSRLIADYIKEYGKQPDPEQMRNFEKALNKKYWQFPFDILLGLGIASATFIGYFKSRRHEYEDSSPITWHTISRLGCSAILVIGLILILNRI